MKDNTKLQMAFYASLLLTTWLKTAIDLCPPRKYNLYRITFHERTVYSKGSYERISYECKQQHLCNMWCGKSVWWLVRWLDGKWRLVFFRLCYLSTPSVNWCYLVSLPFVTLTLVTRTPLSVLEKLLHVNISLTLCMDKYIVGRGWNCVDRLCETVFWAHC